MGKAIGKELLELYRKKIVTRDEIIKMTGKSHMAIYSKIKRYGIELWDKKKKKKKKMYKIKNRDKYFSLKEYKNHYLFNYNK
ncbi:hypothetical protein [Rosettibacter firmus]|uniref:hypothetical protein n=1 Tax=Rosettibacter firmus TaxID=3111522 RepID=UPI00336BCA63